MPCGNRTRLSSLEGWRLCRSANGTYLEMDLNHRPPGYEPGELNHCSTPQSAQRELNSRLLHGKQMGYHYIMGADCLAELSKIGLAASPRYDGGILPLDEQCLFVYYSVGSEGLEPSPP